MYVSAHYEQDEVRLIDPLFMTLLRRRRLFAVLTTLDSVNQHDYSLIDWTELNLTERLITLAAKIAEYKISQT